MSIVSASVAAASSRDASADALASGEGGFDLADRGPLGIADTLTAEPEESLLAGLSDPLGESEDELPVLLDLLVGRLRLEQGDRLPDVVQGVLFELLWGAGAGAIHFGLGRDDLVEEPALAVLLPRLGVGLRHREGLADGAAAVRQDHDQPRARRPLQDRLPLLLREISLAGHGPAVSRNSAKIVGRDPGDIHVDPRAFELDALGLKQPALPIALGQ